MRKPLWRPCRIVLSAPSKRENRFGLRAESSSARPRNAKTTLASLQNRLRCALETRKPLWPPCRIVFGAPSKCENYFGVPAESTSVRPRDAKTTLASVQNRFRCALETRKPLWRPCRIALGAPSKRENHFGVPAESHSEHPRNAKTTLASLQNRSRCALEMRKPLWRPYKNALGGGRRSPSGSSASTPPRKLAKISISQIEP